MSDREVKPPFLCRIGIHQPFYPFKGRIGTLSDYKMCKRCLSTETFSDGWVRYDNAENNLDEDYLNLVYQSAYINELDKVGKRLPEDARQNLLKEPMEKYGALEKVCREKGLKV